MAALALRQQAEPEGEALPQQAVRRPVAREGLCPSARFRAAGAAAQEGAAGRMASAAQRPLLVVPEAFPVVAVVAVPAGVLAASLIRLAQPVVVAVQGTDSSTTDNRGRHA